MGVVWEDEATEHGKKQLYSMPMKKPYPTVWA
jgi:hypothetical protein